MSLPSSAKMENKPETVLDEPVAVLTMEEINNWFDINVQESLMGESEEAYSSWETAVLGLLEAKDLEVALNALGQGVSGNKPARLERIYRYIRERIEKKLAKE